MKKEVYDYIVLHPEYEITTVRAEDKLGAVQAEDKLGAIQAAAKIWGVGWTAVAKDCDVERGRKVKETVCASCRQPYYGAPGGFCGECHRKMLGQPKFKRKDRRVSSGN